MPEGLTVHISNITSFILLYKSSLLSYIIIMLGLNHKYANLALFIGPIHLREQQSRNGCA